ncbi:MAG: hypothetical protein QXH20_06295 [Candidatus Bathyarchaeia archaeon]
MTKSCGRGGMDKKLKEALAGLEAFKSLVENAALPIAISDTR